MVVLRTIKKFSRILSKHQIFHIIELGILMVVAGFFEMLSVSMMIPFIETMMSPDKVMRNSLVQCVMHLLGIESYQIFMVFLALLMAIVYLIKNCFLVFQLTIQEKFVLGNQYALQRRLLNCYLHRPYEFFLSAQSGEIIRVINQDTTYAFIALNQLLSFISETIVSSILLITVFVISPILTLLIAMILLFVTVFIYIVSKRKLRKVGRERIRLSAHMNQTVIQSIQGIKEIKVMHKEDFFEEEYGKCGNASTRADYISRFLCVLPRFVIEATAMCSFFIILAMLLYRGINVEEILPAISSIAMASVRLLPSMNRISLAFSQLTYYEASVDKLIENISELSSDNVEFQSDEKKRISRLKDRIKLCEVSYRYPTGDRDVLDHVQLDIKKGQSVGIIGASGAGKTTVVDVLLGLLKPGNGNILIDGTDISEDIGGWLSQVGYIPQTIFLLDGSIRDNVAFGMGFDKVDDTLVWEALEEAAIAGFVRTLPDGIDTKIGERGVRLSGGQRQRIGIARALYTNPEVLIFDEATSALDNDTEAVIMESIDKLQGNKTMIIIAHRLTTIEKCDVIYKVEDGKIRKAEKG